MTSQAHEPQPAAPEDESPPPPPPRYSPDHEVIDYFKKSGDPDDQETRDES